MSEPFAVISGAWWRFDRYELLDDWYIRPASGARLERYDPWAEYPEGKRNIGLRAPYESAFKMVSEFRFTRGATNKSEADDPRRAFIPTHETTQLLLDWCSKHGLLGLLLQRTKMISTAPRLRGSATTPSRCSYFRTGRGWASFIGSASFKEIAPNPLDIDGRPHAVVEHWTRTRLGPEIGVEPLSSTWAKFFPTVPKGEEETFDYPQPLTEKFWRLYAEPLGGFLDGIEALRLGLLYGQDDGEDPGFPMFAEESMDTLIASVRPALVLSDGKLRQRWTAPSLLGMFAAMVMRDLTESRRVLECAVCGSVFTSTAWQGKYCSERCRNTAQKRAYRQRKKKLTTSRKRKKATRSARK